MKRANLLVVGIMRDGLAAMRENMFDIHILDDLSCKHFKATTFEFPPVITVNRLDNGTLE